MLVPLIYLDFEVRKDYIAKVLCIKRDKPMTVCGGSCYLAKKLDLAQKQEEKKEAINPSEISFFHELNVQIEVSRNNFSILKSSFFKYNEPYSGLLNSFDIFHPPRLG